jgi:hypothetical protein
VSDPHKSNLPLTSPAQPGADGQEPAHLFTLRLWQAELGNGRREWRGRLHHVGHDNVSYFRGWAALLPLLLAMLRRAGVTISVEENLNHDS